MKIHLVDLNDELVECWREAFAPIESVEVSRGNILELASDTIVSPANSYGYMDGGIDRAYRDYFGIRIEQTVQAQISQRAEKYLPVGEAILVDTGDDRIPRMICAPTMISSGTCPFRTLLFGHESGSGMRALRRRKRNVLSGHGHGYWASFTV